MVEVLKNVTESGKAPTIAAGNTEEKYKVVAPETMQENFMSDSEDEGGKYYLEKFYGFRLFRFLFLLNRTSLLIRI